MNLFISFILHLLFSIKKDFLRKYCILDIFLINYLWIILYLIILLTFLSLKEKMVNDNYFI